jgi:hypothetical protein
MNAQTNHPINNTTDPQFLGPEAGQQANGKAEGKTERKSAGKPGRENAQTQAHELGDMRTILQAALTQPGVMNQAYRAFHNYSIGNQLLAALQLLDKGLPLAPIASFNAWREKGRFVKKGEKAICLFMPISVKRRADKDAPADSWDEWVTEGRSCGWWRNVQQVHVAPELVFTEPDRGRCVHRREHHARMGCGHRHGRARHCRRTLRAPAGQLPGLCLRPIHRYQPAEPVEAQNPVS